jgi:hypothetical protein
MSGQPHKRSNTPDPSVGDRRHSRREVQAWKVVVATTPHEERQFVRILLQGYSTTTKDGRSYKHFWEDMSDEENAGRRILGRLILSGAPLTQEVREQLAALIDPNNNRYPSITRRIKFQEKTRGRKHNSFNDTLVARRIYDAVKSGRTVKEGVDDAAEWFVIGERQIRKIWGRYKPSFEIIYGQLPRPSPQKKR